MKTMRAGFVVVAAIVATTLSQAQIFVLLNRTHEFEQTGASTTSEIVGNPWVFEAAISGSGLTASYPATPNQITLPDNTTVYNLVDPVTLGSSEWRYRPGNFSSLSAMTTSFPNGTYTFEFNGHTWTPTLGSTGFAPAEPVANISISGSWSGSTLTISSAQAAAGFSISTTWGTGFSSGSSRVGIYVDHSSGPDSFTTVQDDNGGSNFTVSSASINIAPGALLAGNSYKVGLEFNAFLEAPVDFEVNVFKAVVLNSVTTEFQIQVIPEPSTYAALLGAVALTGTMLLRRRRLPA